MDHGENRPGLEEGRRPAGRAAGLPKRRRGPEELLSIKQEKKRALCKALQQREGVALEEDSIFDIQIKRLHEYKRQQMNALYIIWKYRQIKAGHRPTRPITLLFGAKAAPAYTHRQGHHPPHPVPTGFDCPRPRREPWLKVHMVENYNITWAEKLTPACDISEQISLASKEASGTGNMKFMLNGAVTLGTLDGANVEIHDLVGEENVYIFGQPSEKVMELYDTASYRPGTITAWTRKSPSWWTLSSAPR